MASVWMPEDNRWKPILSFHHSSQWNLTRHQAESAARTSTQPYSENHLPPLWTTSQINGYTINHSFKTMEASKPTDHLCSVTAGWAMLLFEKGSWSGCVRQIERSWRSGGGTRHDGIPLHICVWSSQGQRKRSEESMLDNGTSAGIIASECLGKWPDLFCCSPTGTHPYECWENTLLLGPDIRPITENFSFCYLSVRIIPQFSLQNRNSKFCDCCFL